MGDGSKVAALLLSGTYLLVGNRFGSPHRLSPMDTITSTLMTLATGLGAGLGLIAVGTGTARAVARRKGRERGTW